jgi:hypothetical protein
MTSAPVTKLPSVRARVDALIVLCQGLALEQERTRVQTSYVSEICQDLLKAVLTLKAEPHSADQLN